MRQIPYGPGLLALLLLGCSSDAPRALSTAVRDSAGVRIVENRGSSKLATLWQVDRTPILDLGGEGSGPPLYQITGAVRLSDGRIVIASAGMHELRIYAAEGSLLSRLGREGQGPGEFQAPFWVGVLPGDTIAAWDVGLSRLSLFSPQGQFVRSTSPRGSLGTFPRAVGVLDSRGVVFVAGAGTGPLDLSGKSVQRDSVTVLVLDPSGGAADTIGRFPGTEQVALGSPQEGMLVRPLPFGKSTEVAGQGDLVYVGTGDRYELSAYDPSVGLLALIRADRKLLPVTEEDIEDYRRTLVTIGAEGDAQAKRQQERLLAAAPFPKTMPAFTGIKPDAEGNLWVQDPQKPGDETGALWIVFSPDLEARGTVRLPDRLQVQQIGRDWVLGIRLDEDDVEHVQLYRLRK